MDFTNFRPINKLILIKKEKRDEKTTGGLFYPNINQHRTYKGTILACDRKIKKLKKKDVVFFALYSTIKELDDDLVIIGENDVLGFYEKT